MGSIHQSFFRNGISNMKAILSVCLVLTVLGAYSCLPQGDKKDDVPKPPQAELPKRDSRQVNDRSTIARPIPPQQLPGKPSRQVKDESTPSPTFLAHELVDPPRRPNRQVKDESTQRPPLPGSLGQPQVDPVDPPKRVSRQTKDLPKDEVSAPPVPAASEPAPKDRVARQNKDVPRPQQRPQVDPIKPGRVARQTKDLPKDEVSAPHPVPAASDPAPSDRLARQTKDIPRPQQRPQVDPIRPGRVNRQSDLPKEASSIRASLPGSLGQPQVQPIRKNRDVQRPQTQPTRPPAPEPPKQEKRQTKDVPKGSLAVPIPQPIDPKPDQPPAIRVSRQTKDIPKPSVPQAQTFPAKPQANSKP